MNIAEAEALIRAAIRAGEEAEARRLRWLVENGNRAQRRSAERALRKKQRTGGPA